MTTSVKLAATAVLVLALAGCGRGGGDQADEAQPQAPAPPADVGPGPDSPLASAPEFASCAWREMRGAGLSIGAFVCGPDIANSHLVPSDDLPGFWLEETGDLGAVQTVAVQTFQKAADAPVTAVLPAVRAASPGEFTGSCELVKAPHVEALPDDRYVLEPAGDLKAEWEASVESDTPIALPCGPLGVGIAGDRYFRELPGDPTRVAFVELGSDLRTYDANTLKAAPAG